MKVLQKKSKIGINAACVQAYHYKSDTKQIRKAIVYVTRCFPVILGY